MSNRNRWTGRAALALLAALALTAPAAAQTDVTSSRIGGTVSDASGGALPGATVEARNQDTGLVVIGVTDQRGSYRLLNLPTGLYTVTASLDGFATAERVDLRLLIGSAPTVNFDLQSASVTETITVTSEVPVVEVTNTAIGTLIQEEQIDAIPTNNRDFKSIVVLTPQARFDSERGNLSISGQRGINTNVTVDGVDFNNSFFGGTVGGAEGRAPLSISTESIKEVSVITNGASVEFGRSGGGFVNVITKSGTNSLHGSLFYYNQPESLISDFANGVEPREQDKDAYGGSIGGAILQDKLFYFVSYDQQSREETVPIDASVIDAAVFAKYPVLATPSTYVQTQDGDVTFGRMDWQIDPSHRAMFRANFTDYEGVNGTSSGTTRAESLNGVEGLDTKAYVASYSGQFGAHLLNDLNLNYITEDTPRLDKGLGLPEIQIANISTYGEVSFLPIVSTVERKAIGDTLTFLTGAHVLKAGVEYNDTSIDQIFKGNWRGVYLFPSKTELIAGRWTQYRQFGGQGGLTSDQAGQAAFGQKETAIFFQDQWFIASNLTLTGGLRFEDLDNPNDAILNPQDRNANGSFSLTGQVPDADLTDQISPRLGLSWSPGDDQKTAVRFSAGRFWSRTPAILLAQLYTSNGVRGTQYIISTPGTGLPPTDPLSPGWGAAFNPVGVEAIDFTKVPFVARPGVFTIDEGFENPYTDRFTLGAEREILPNTVVGLDYTYAKGKQLQRLTDSNLQYDGTTAANGLPRYSSTRPNSFYGRITTSLSDAESTYNGVTLSIRRRLVDGLGYGASVSWSEDKDSDSNERNFSGIQAEDVNNLGLNDGFSNRDQEWKFSLGGVWETPWWGIGMSAGFRYATGSPYNVLVGSEVNNDGTPGTDRPTIDGVHVERNSERQPDFYSLDFRLSKAFEIGPGSLSLFAECFNCTDRANWTVPAGNQRWGNSNLATPSNVNFDKATTPGTPRTLQFGLRWDF